MTKGSEQRPASNKRQKQLTYEERQRVHTLLLPSASCSLLCCTIHAFADSTSLCSLQVAELEEFLFAKGPTSEPQHAEDGAERPIAQLILQASSCKFCYVAASALPSNTHTYCFYGRSRS